MNYSRRSVLAGGALGTVAVGASFLLAAHRLSNWPSAGSAGNFASPLIVPPLIDARNLGNVVTLEAKAGTTEFHPGAASRTLGYSGSYLGPVVRVHRGDTVSMTVVNNMDRRTSVHWHGLLVPSELDGGPYNAIEPGEVWQPFLTIDQAASTAWYHPHPHGDTARQVYFGLAGLLYVEDGMAETLGLPRRYGVDDIPLILQDREFGVEGLLRYDNSAAAIQHGSRGSTILVNGVIGPYAPVPRGVVRLRILNGANARNFMLVFDDRRVMKVIANDNGFMATPAPVAELLIAPGERYEVLVDFSDGGTAVLLSYPDNINPPGIPGLYPPDDPAQDETLTAVMRFDPTDGAGERIQYVPQKLVAVEPPALPSSTAHRSFVLDGMADANEILTRGASSMQGMDHSRMNANDGSMAGMDHPRLTASTAPRALSGLDMGMKMGINGKPFDESRIDAHVKIGETEIWHLRSTEMAHPFHIHGASFRILSLDGAPPPPHLNGPKDTLLVRDEAEILVSFKHKTDSGKPFVFHCHILEHGDAGMMAQYAAF